MNSKKLFLTVATLTIVLLAAVAFYNSKNKLVNNGSDAVQPSPISTVDQNLTSHTIKELGLIFSAPKDLNFEYQAQNNDKGEISSLTMYLQKGTPPDQYYQLYGITQWDLGPIDSLENYKQELNPESIQEITVDGKPALQGQIKGQRNRFVTYILLDGQVLTLFTADPTQENKELTDQVIATFKFE